MVYLHPILTPEREDLATIVELYELTEGWEFPEPRTPIHKAFNVDGVLRLNLTRKGNRYI